MPYYTTEGFSFTVLDADPINGDDVIGRCYVDPQQAKTVMENQSPLLLSLGDGIGVLKVRIQKADSSTGISSAAKSLDDLWLRRFWRQFDLFLKEYQ